MALNSVRIEERGQRKLTQDKSVGRENGRIVRKPSGASRLRPKDYVLNVLWNSIMCALYQASIHTI